nr:hypothetical protein [Tanacetum cinerariifolium]
YDNQYYYGNTSYQVAEFNAATAGSTTANKPNDMRGAASANDPKFVTADLGTAAGTTAAPRHGRFHAAQCGEQPQRAWPVYAYQHRAGRRCGRVPVGQRRQSAAVVNVPMPLSSLRTSAVATLLAAVAFASTSCQHAAQATSGILGATLAADGTNTGPGVVRPVVVTQPVRYDTDDPAIWVNAQDPAKSLVIGTDKDSDGGLYVFDLQGKEVPNKSVHGLKRPNNVDLAYGLKLGGHPTDFALVTERETGKLRAFRLPDMQPLDHGNLDVFLGAPAEQRMPMGVAIYTRPSDGVMFAVVGRKTGPSEGYLAQYRLADDGQGQLTMTRVRSFGTWSGKKEIESIAVDNELGFIYYSDEG